MSSSALDDLQQRWPDLRLTRAADDLLHYGRDWTRRWTPAPLAVAFPAGVEEVVGIVQWANAHGVGIVPSGGRTGLSGGAVAAHGELVLSMDRMQRIGAFDPVTRTLEVQAGATLQAVQDAARAHGLQYPVDFAARGSATIGGSVATNAGGIRVLRYGNTRDWIAGLTVVDGRGEVLHLNRGLLKNSSGYDLRHLMIASEGTLGIVTEAVLRLTDPPPPVQTLLFAVPDFEAIMPLFGHVRGVLDLEAFEFFSGLALEHVLAHGGADPFEDRHPYYVVIDAAKRGDADDASAMAAFAHALEQGWVADGVIAASDTQAAHLWRLREGITESIAARLPYKNDVAVRISAMPAFLAQAQALLDAEYPQLEVVWFGHIGDGNLHINVLRPEDMDAARFVRECERVTRLLAEVLHRHGGSISAEHGIGLVKKPYLQGTRSAGEIEAMRGIKRAFDPNGILNPGKVFDPPVC